MASAVADRIRPRVDALAAARWATPALLVALVAISVVLRTRVLDAGLWIDEGLSIGIAQHSLSDIPGLLRQDGSPPLYYLVLHVWIRWFGESEQATHALALLFAVACIPAAFWAASAFFGRVAGWICAALAAVDPYLSAYGQETRMYTMLALLSFAATVSFVRAVVEGRRRWLPALVLSLAAMLYTHNWALFFCLGLVAATLVAARAHLREAVVAAGGTLLLYSPWLPTLLDQVRHTGAPWSREPSLHSLVLAPGSVFAGDAPLVAFALAAGVGFPLIAREGVRNRRILQALAAIVVATIVVAWTASQISPAWATRYFAVVLAASLLLGAAGVARAGRVGAIALALVLVLWTNNSPRDDKSDVRELSELVAPFAHRGDLVLSTHPEQVPVLRYYLGDGFRWATTLGPVPDPRIHDWRDAVDRLEAAPPRATYERIVAGVPAGGRMIVVRPIFRDYRGWQAEWTKLVYQRSRQWERLLRGDRRLRLVAHLQPDEFALEKRFSKPVQADVYVRRG